MRVVLSFVRRVERMSVILVKLQGVTDGRQGGRAQGNGLNSALLHLNFLTSNGVYAIAVVFST